MTSIYLGASMHGHTKSGYYTITQCNERQKAAYKLLRQEKGHSYRIEKSSSTLVYTIAI